MANISKAEAALALDKLQKSSALFFTDVLGVQTLEDYQRNKILKAVDENDRVVIKACHDLGKTFTMARIALSFLSCFAYSKVITTAPTYNQVVNILWSEMRSAHAKSKVPLGGKMNLAEWKLDDEWFALGFSPKKDGAGSDEGQGANSSFQGFHAQGGILIIFDEATGIPPSIWKMAEGLMTQHNVRFVAIGNPTSKNTEFYRKFQDPFWFKVNLSCFDSPNLIANGFTTKAKLAKEVAYVKSLKDADKLKRVNSYKVVSPYLLTTKWVVTMLTTWGLDHPLSQAKIFGEFPNKTATDLISLGAVEQAQLRTYFPTKDDRKSIGIDIARYGSDSSVLTALHGKKQVGYKKVNHRSTGELVGEALAFAQECFADDGGNADIFVTDETGLGAGVTDGLKSACAEGLDGAKGAVTRGIQFGANAGDKNTDEGAKLCKKYRSIKARMYDLLAEDINDENGLVLMDESDYQRELPAMRKRYNEAGQMVMESKDEFKKRTSMDSPDSSDSLALANFGRYDDLDNGVFGNEHTQTVAPLAVRLANTKNW